MMSENSKSDNCDKSSNRTHHTRFFEKLYGNLDKSDDKKDEICEENNLDFHQERRVVSPSESSVSSSEVYSNYESNMRSSSMNFPQSHHHRTTDIHGVTNVNLHQSPMFSNHFGSLRIPAFGFPPDSHNHFAAFCKLICQLECSVICGENCSPKPISSWQFKDVTVSA